MKELRITIKRPRLLYEVPYTRKRLLIAPGSATKATLLYLFLAYPHTVNIRIAFNGSKKC